MEGGRERLSMVKNISLSASLDEDEEALISSIGLFTRDAARKHGIPRIRDLRGLDPPNPS